MDTILDVKKFFCLQFVFSYFQQMLHVIIVLFVSGNYIGILFWQDGAGHLHNGCNFSMIQCNGQCSTLCVWNFPCNMQADE